VTTWPIIVTVPFLPPSPNKLLGRHWRASHQVKRIWQDAIYYLLTKAQRDEIALVGHSDQKLGIMITQFRNRRLDPDNLTASVKVCLDAMTRGGLIADDSERHIKLVVDQKDALGTPQRTLVSFHKE